MFTMMTAIILLVPHLFYNKRIVENRVLFYLSLYTSFIGMFLTFSLTIVLQFAGFIVAVFLLSRRSTVKKLLTMFSVMTVVFIGTNVAISTYAGSDLFDLYFRRVASNIVGEDKIEAVSGDSFGVRADAQKAAISIWKANPILGSGFGCLGYVGSNEGLIGVNALQMYLFAFATTGALGGLAIVVYTFGLSIGMMRVLIRRQRERTDSAVIGSEDIVLAIAAFLCCNEAVHGLSSDDLILQYHWVVMGVVSLVYYHPFLNVVRGTSVVVLAFRPSARVSLFEAGKSLTERKSA
jgi:O-antigen ligase